MSNKLRQKYAPEAERAQDWRDVGECRTADPELFFPIGKTGFALEQINEAKALCAKCLSQIACLSYALENDQAGIWGGTTEDERRALKRRALRSRRMGSDAIERS